MQIRNVEITNPQTDVWLSAGLGVVGLVFGGIIVPSQWGTFMLLIGAVNVFNAWRLWRQIRHRQP